MTIGLLKRKWDVKFQFQVLVPIEQEGEFAAPLEADATAARMMFTKMMKEQKPELKNVKIIEFTPHLNDAPEKAPEAESPEVPEEPKKETLN